MTLNVLDFGADPCGHTDSWQAFKSWSQAITNRGGGIGLVPPGQYKIDRTAGNESGNEFRPDDFLFEGCDGLQLVGYGATLNLKGDVTLAPDLVHGWGSDRHMVCPFLVRQCRNVSIEGFEINGNADKLTPGSVIEPGSHCISVSSSSHVTIRHMRIHHGWTDAINVRAKDYLAASEADWRTARTIVIENCELYGNVRAGIAVHETRHVRVADCRIYDCGMGIDIEPDLWIGTTIDPQDPAVRPFDTGIRPGGRSDIPGWSRFTVVDNCEIHNCEKPLSAAVLYSHVRIQGCYIDNERDSAAPVILAVPHCSLLDSEIDAGTGSIWVGISQSTPGRVVFTMERCLVRTHSGLVDGTWTTGHGLMLAAETTDVGGGIIAPRVRKALIANNHFVNESSAPWFADGTDNGTRLPNLSHGNSAIQIAFRDNLVFIPQQAHHRHHDPAHPTPYMSAVGLHVQLAENNVFETDLAVDGAYFQVLYGSDTADPPTYGVHVRNERYLAGGDGRGFRPGDNTQHDNDLPFGIP